MRKEIIEETDIGEDIKTTIKGYKEKGILHVTEMKQEKELPYYNKKRIKEILKGLKELIDEDDTNLSKKIGLHGEGFKYLELKDVKEFIMKERNIIDKAHFNDWSLTKTMEELDKLAGEDLI